MSDSRNATYIVIENESLRQRLTAANERIMELEAAFEDAENRIIELRNELTAERAISNKLEKALLHAAKESNDHHTTDFLDAALAEVEAMRKEGTKSINSEFKGGETDVKENDNLERLKARDEHLAQWAAGEIEQLEKDAARWRWLTNDCDGNEQDDFIRWLAGIVTSKADIDAKIDEAMAVSNASGKPATEAAKPL